MPSSPITPVRAHQVDQSLLGVLAKVPDPRDPRGVRYPLPGMLAVAVCAVLAGARSFAAIGEWALDLSAEQLGRIELDKAPVESTMRKLFARLDAAALDRQLAVLAWTRTRHIGGRRVIAIDGKTVRGARSATTAAPHLVAALDHATGIVLGQNAIEAKSNEIPAVRDLLAGFDPADLSGCLITADAMHTQDDTRPGDPGRRRRLRAHRQGQPSQAAQGAQGAALGQDPGRVHQHRPRSRPARATHHQSHRRPHPSRLARVHRRRPGRPTATHRGPSRQEREEEDDR